MAGGAERRRRVEIILLECRPGRTSCDRQISGPKRRQPRFDGRGLGLRHGYEGKESGRAHDDKQCYCNDTFHVTIAKFSQ